MTTEHQKQTTQHRARIAERRAVTQETVQKLITERTEMLALYCQMAGLEPYKNSKNGKNSRTKPSQEMLQKFCQVLVDYIAAGHFSLYERIVNGTERRQQVSTLAENLYPQIAHSTEAALDFNDKYDCGDHCEIGLSFADDLSRLGEKLASRIELEDRMIKHLIESRRSS
jgi:regulator of sigma D